MTLRLFAMIVVALVCVAAHADDEIQSFVLPEDGAWAKYRMTASRMRGGRTETQESEWTLSSVGKVERDGKACRWLEFAMTGKDVSGNELRGVINVLIPEDAFRGADHPLRMVVEGKYRRPGSPNVANVDWESSLDSPLATVIPGPLEDCKRLDARMLSSPAGDVDCNGIHGRYDLESEREGRFTFIRSAWVHPDAPFGVVRAELKLKLTRDGEERDLGDVTLELIEQGVGAKRQLQ